MMLCDWCGFFLKGTIKSIFLLALFFCLITGLPAAESSPHTEVEVQLLAYETRALGSIDAPVRVVEFLALDCPYCTRFSREVFPEIKENYIDTDKVLWTFRIFPLSDVSLTGHGLLATVAPDKFHSAKNHLMENTNRWLRADDIEFFDEFRKKYNISKTAPEQDTIDHILARRQAFVEKGITSLPAFLINGRLLSGGHPYEKWQQLLDRLIDELEVDEN